MNHGEILKRSPAKNTSVKAHVGEFLLRGKENS